MMEIGLIPTDALLDELEKRFKTMVFSGLMDMDSDFEKQISRHSGHYRTSQGLCMNLILKLNVIPGTQPMTSEDM